MGRQHQGMDRPGGVRQNPEGSGEQGKLEETGCKIIGGAPTTLAVKGLMMMLLCQCQCTGVIVSVLVYRCYRVSVSVQALLCQC